MVITARPAGVKSLVVPTSFSLAALPTEQQRSCDFMQPLSRPQSGFYQLTSPRTGAEKLPRIYFLDHSNRRSAAVRHQYLPIPHRPNTTFFLWYFSRIFASLSTSYPSSHSRESRTVLKLYKAVKSYATSRRVQGFSYGHVLYSFTYTAAHGDSSSCTTRDMTLKPKP